MKVAVIGAGYWGPNLIRNFLTQDEVEDVIACDLDEDRLAKMQKTFHGIETSTDYEDVIERDRHRHRRHRHASFPASRNCQKCLARRQTLLYRKADDRERRRGRRTDRH